ncbi:hypothetical protein [Kitasatospora sp. NPDC101183]|uniref:hypothetical protein n=1 Tax=Kitasatospora sp. NPDC101183 TaxID=3364100 RepID=UPI0038303139
MSDHLDHARRPAYLARLPKRLGPDALINAAKVEAYLAIAAAIAYRRGDSADETPRPQ